MSVGAEPTGPRPPEDRPLRVGLVQMRVEDGEPDRNIARAAALLADAEPADVYLLPELFTTGYAYDSWPGTADHAASTVAELRRVAEDLGAALVAGTIARNDERRLVNRLWLVAAGQDTVTYDKGHLFPPLQEDARLAAGHRRCRASIGGWTVGLSICFDLRFPEHYRLDALDGAHAFFVISEWPAARREALRTLARARAIENQAFLALCNRTGVAADGTEFGGGSALITPDGDLLLDAGADEGVHVAVLDPGTLRRSREWVNLESHRRAGLDW